MSGKKPHLSALDARKQLLILESELNRTHLVQEIREVRVRVRAVTDRLQSFGAMARAATAFFSSLNGGGERDEKDQPRRKRSGLGKLAGMAMNLFSLFQSNGRD